MRSMSLVVDLIDLVTKHKSGELRCPATALIDCKIENLQYNFLLFFIFFQRTLIVYIVREV